MANQVLTINVTEKVSVDCPRCVVTQPHGVQTLSTSPSSGSDLGGRSGGAGGSSGGQKWTYVCSGWSSDSALHRTCAAAQV